MSKGAGGVWRGRGWVLNRWGLSKGRRWFCERALRIWDAAGRGTGAVGPVGGHIIIKYPTANNAGMVQWTRARAYVCAWSRVQFAYGPFFF
jgi:hypothetical protein